MEVGGQLTFQGGGGKTDSVLFKGKLEDLHLQLRSIFARNPSTSS